MKTDRLFGIVHCLLNGKTTTGELAERFGVSKRTILRDLETLSLAGVPVCTASGNGGGVSVLDGYVLDKTALSESEREQIACGIKVFAQFGTDRQSAQKLAAVFSRTDADWIDVDFSGWGAKFDSDKFAALKHAVTGGRAIRFEYVGSSGGRVWRSVYPLKLVYKSKAWYVQAYCLLRGAYRTFKISRMSEVTVLPQTFDPREYSPPPIDIAQSDWQAVDICATFARGVAYRVFDEFDANEITENADGSLTVRTSMPYNDYISGYLMSFGDALLELSPKGLRDEITCKCKILFENFSKVT